MGVGADAPETEDRRALGAASADGRPRDPERARVHGRRAEAAQPTAAPDAPPAGAPGGPATRGQEEGPIEQKGRTAPLDAAQDLVRGQFGPRAERYVTSADHARGESLDRLVEWVRPEAHWRVLDVATGGGHTALALAPLVREVVAADVTAEMLEAAERHLRGRGVSNVAFCEADATNLPFGPAEFDLVTCRVAPHHFPDCARFVAETSRVLRPGGVAAVIDNVVPDDPDAAQYINELEKLRDPSHHWAYPCGEWRSFFERAGLVVERAETFRKARDFDAWAERMGVTGALRARLRGLLVTASGAAGEALAPSPDGERIRFYLTELLIIARRPG
jgi:SAM-dependent methyltransferase